MLVFHITFFLGLISLAAGTALLGFSKHANSATHRFVKAISLIIIVLSILSTLCTMYYGFKSWQSGSGFQCPMAMHGMMNDQGMPGCGMMQNCMEHCKNMMNHPAR